jgi:hypothetical protein
VNDIPYESEGRENHKNDEGYNGGMYVIQEYQ